MRVAFQGETGAYSEEAVLGYYQDKGVELVPCASFEDAFEQLASGAVERAMLPIENSLHGSVHANYDLLREHEVHIVGELKLRIVHHLLALHGTKSSELKKVFSHPQALGQCQAYLRTELPHVQAVPAYDTAGAAKMVAQEGVSAHAAIASEAAAEEYDLEVLAGGIESNHQNYTRFLVLAPEAKQSPSNGKTKTSIVYAMKTNVPGALFKSLAVFSLREIDLFKIESRPLVGSPWEYLFYLDISGAVHEEHVQRALDHLSELTAYLKVLGSYPEGKVLE